MKKGTKDYKHLSNLQEIVERAKTEQEICFGDDAEYTFIQTPCLYILDYVKHLNNGAVIQEEFERKTDCSIEDFLKEALQIIASENLQERIDELKTLQDEIYKYKSKLYNPV